MQLGQGQGYCNDLVELYLVNTLAAANTDM